MMSPVTRNRVGAVRSDVVAVRWIVAGHRRPAGAAQVDKGQQFFTDKSKEIGGPTCAVGFKG